MNRLSDYLYHLPEDLIAQVPLSQRSASRLLRLHRQSGRVEHLNFTDTPGLLNAGDLLVLNNTRVSAVRLLGRRQTGGAVEALLLHEVERNVFEALMKPGKKLQPGEVVHFDQLPEAKVLENLGEGLKRIQFDCIEDLSDLLSTFGSVPLPPYIHERLDDRERYQTTYGSEPGSAAAPTAGLHFTPALLDALRQRGVEIATINLNVGIDTFRPVQVEDLAEHKMHGERCTVSEDTARAIHNCRGRVVAVGTTTVRALESMATAERTISAGTLDTKLFIQPGFRFRIVDGMFTNFHLPGTTMMLMISALAGRDNILAAYREAVKQRYRFLSFGDSMLIL